jgi:NAD(P)H-nitrite reductase large subunit
MDIYPITRFIQYHESQGVKFHMKSQVDKIVPQDGNPNVAGGVVVNGTTIAADFIVMGVGVAPATELLKGSGIEIEKDGGVKVDEYLRVQSGPDTQNVYAIGSFHSLVHRCFRYIHLFQATLQFIQSDLVILRG